MTSSTTKYFHDRVVLLLTSVNGFLAFAGCVFVLIQLSINHGNGYIVQCRDCTNPANFNGFMRGSVVELLAFAVFPLVIMAIHSILSLRAYRIHRQLAVTILGMGTLLLLLTVIVANALLILR